MTPFRKLKTPGLTQESCNVALCPSEWKADMKVAVLCSVIDEKEVDQRTQGSMKGRKMCSMWAPQRERESMKACLQKN